MIRTPRILIADDHEVVRRGLRALLEAEGWSVVAEAADGHEAVAAVRRQRIDVAVMDVSMPGLNGLVATEQLLAVSPRTGVLILTMHESEQLLREIVRVGGLGYVLKGDAGRYLVDGVRAVARHEPYFSARVARLALATPPGPGDAVAFPPRDPLTAREREVVQLLAEGHTTAEVAARLGIRPKTVEAHRSNVLHKLGLRNVVDLVHYAVRNGLVAS